MTDIVQGGELRAWFEMSPPLHVGIICDADAGAGTGLGTLIDV